MSSRPEGKKAAREARLAAEREAEDRARRQRIWALAGGAALLAVIVVVALIALSSGDSDDEGTGTADVSLIDGIPQSGIALGDPKAPVTLVEFADPQCPFCADYTADVQPELISEYVEPGDLRMELNLLTFIGPDSEAIARAAYAAVDQERMWQFMDVAYAQQGTENSGYADQEFIDGVAEEAGVQIDLDAAVNSEQVTKLLEDARSAASDAGVDSTPSFLVGPTGGDLQPVDQQDLTSAIEDQIAAE